MTQAVFGKSFIRSFTADDGREYIDLPSQTPTIYIFDYAPSYDQAVNGTNAVETISTWTQQQGSQELRYTISAIDDPEQSGSIIEREYWECIKYTLANSEQVQAKIRMFTVKRANVLESIPNLRAADVIAVWPHVKSYLTDSQLEQFLPSAEAELRLYIGSDNWGKCSGLSDTKIALAYKAIEMMAASQVVKGNSDKFTWMVEYFGGKYSETISKINLMIDVDSDGKPDQQLSAGNVVFFSQR